MRFLLRLISIVFLACAVIAGVVDSIQSVAGNAVLMTSLGTTLFSFFPDFVLEAETYVETHVSNIMWDDVVGWLLAQPAFAVFLGLSLLFYLPAYRRPQTAVMRLSRAGHFG